MIKTRIKKFLCYSLVSAFLLTSISFISHASEPSNFFNEMSMSKETTTVTIYNEETGEKTKYIVDVKPEYEISTNDEGETVITETVRVDPPVPAIMPLGDVRYSEKYYGWQGEVHFAFTDDGTYACLTQAAGEWTKLSGSYSISNRSLNYGQVLGTNSASGSYDMSSNYVQFNTGFKKGKYGKGGYLGATLNAKIGSNWVSIEHNRSLY